MKTRLGESMRLFRFGSCGCEKPAVMLDSSKGLDVSAFCEDFDERFFASAGLHRLGSWIRENGTRCPAVDPSARIGCCIARPSKIVCVGLNYARHAAEGGAEVPSEPIVFLKATSSMCGANDNLVIPKDAQKVDWEVELAFVMDKKARYVRPQEAMEYVAGYCVHNDYSERSFQLERGGQWVKGKSCDSFGPLGPFLVTRDEVKDPHNLRLWLKVNGVMMQDSNTADFIFRIPFLLSYISHFMTLLPGDVISTGTPQGVGAGMKPPQYISPGDVIEFGIEGLGSAQQHAITYNQTLTYAAY